jgi:hypothetical protein
MTTPYNYVQIVVDDDWGLVGIVPPGSVGYESNEITNKQEKIKPDSTRNLSTNEQELEKFSSDIYQNDLSLLTKISDDLSPKISKSTIVNISANDLESSDDNVNEFLRELHPYSIITPFNSQLFNSQLLKRQNSISSFPSQITPVDLRTISNKESFNNNNPEIEHISSSSIVTENTKKANQKLDDLSISSYHPSVNHMINYPSIIQQSSLLSTNITNDIFVNNKHFINTPTEPKKEFSINELPNNDSTFSHNRLNIAMIPKNNILTGFSKHS